LSVFVFAVSADSIIGLDCIVINCKSLNILKLINYFPLHVWSSFSLPY